MKNHRFNLLCVLLLLLEIFPATYSAAASGGEVTTKEMERILNAAFRGDAPGAAVLVVQNGMVKLRRGYGLADVELGVPMDPTDVLPVCSITKQFSAVAILQMVEAGKLKLTDTLGMFVPDYPTGARVTLAQLLWHTSGIPGAEELPAWRKSWGEDLAANQILDFVRNKPLEFAPGSDFKYSNMGYILLGSVIEKVSNQSYPDYVRTHLFAPAGMTNSYYADDNRIIPGRVAGYTRSGKKWENAPHLNLAQTSSAGAILSSVDDMWAWEQALQAGHLVSTGLLESAYTEGHLPDGRSTHYGFGWEINKLGTYQVIEHAGGIPGFSSYEASVPEAGIYIVVLCNTYSPVVPLRTLVANLLRVALGETLAITNLPSHVTLGDYTGTYQMSAGTTFIVTTNNNQLYGKLGTARRPLKLTGPDEFATPDSEWDLIFKRDTANHVEKLLVRTDGPGPELVWPKVEDKSTH